MAKRSLLSRCPSYIYMLCSLHTSRTSLVSTMASNIRKRFGDVTGEEEVAADNELDEYS